MLSKQHWQQRQWANRPPGWVEKVDNGYRLIPKRAKIVRQMFAWSIKGEGTGRIARRLLNEAGTPCFGRGRTWSSSYIAYILRAAAPRWRIFGTVTDQEGKRVATSKPIPNYFPAVVSPETFFSKHSRV